MKAQLITLEAGPAGEIELNDAIFGLEPRADILHRVVRWQRAKAQAGTHSVKTRSDVAYSTKKIYKQKGTGRARHGDKKVPQFRGGGHAHHKQRDAEDYAKDMPKKMRRKANLNALLSKLLDNEVRVVDAMSMAAPRTRDFVSFLEAIKVDKSALVAVPADNDNVRRSGRNVESVTLCQPSQLNCFEMLNHRYLVIAKGDLQAFLEGPQAQTGKSAKISPLGRNRKEAA